MATASKIAEPPPEADASSKASTSRCRVRSRVKATALRQGARRLATLASSVRAAVAGSDAMTKGAFRPAVTWPIIPVHVVLLPDGRTLSYGTTVAGRQNAALVYDVWDPALGTDASAIYPARHHEARTCSAARETVLAATGDVLIHWWRPDAE